MRFIVKIVLLNGFSSISGGIGLIDSVNVQTACILITGDSYINISLLCERGFEG